MKLFKILCLGAVMALPQFTLAELPLSEQALGQVDGTMDYCSQVNPKSVAKYKEQAKAFVAGASDKDLEKARKSEEYKKSYDWISGELQKAPKDISVSACTDFLEGK